MTENSTSTHETHTFTDDNLSWDFVNEASDSSSSDRFKWTWVIICFCGIIVGGVFYVWCRLIKGETDDQDINVENESADDEIIERNTLV